MIEAFAGERKSFDKPILASIAPGSKTKVVGFITRESLENFGLADYVAVFTCLNPTTSPVISCSFQKRRLNRWISKAHRQWHLLSQAASPAVLHK